MTLTPSSPSSARSTPSNESRSEPPPPSQMQKRPAKPRGFAAMDPKKVSEIAKKGGRAAHEAGTAHRFTKDEAREAGRKGGLAPHKRRKNNSDS
jgi:uncharacterized protein